VSETYHSTLSTTHNSYSRKNNTTSKDNIRKGATMQPITINQQYPTHTCTIHRMQNKIKQFMLDLRALHAPGLALLRVKLLKTCGYRPSGTSCSTFSFFRMGPPTSGPTCDDNDVY
jgi:hypothetical protein